MSGLSHKSSMIQVDSDANDILLNSQQKLQQIKMLYQNLKKPFKTRSSTHSSKFGSTKAMSKLSERDRKLSLLTGDASPDQSLLYASGMQCRRT